MKLKHGKHHSFQLVLLNSVIVLYVYLPLQRNGLNSFSHVMKPVMKKVEEEIESSRTNSYIDVVQNNAETDTDANNESVVDTEGAGNTEENEEDDLPF